MLEDGPAALYLLDEASGTTMTDSSGNGRNGTYTSATLAQAAIANVGTYSAAFTSANSRGSVTYGSWMNANSVTLTMLVTVTELSGQYTLAARDDGANNRSLFLENYQSQYYGVAWNASGTMYYAPPQTISTSTAYHIATVYESNVSTRTYVNGSMVQSLPVSGALKATTENLYLGGKSSDGLQLMGRLSHVGYFTSVLSDARILAHAQAAGLA